MYSMVQPFAPYEFNRRFLNIRSIALHTFGVKVTFPLSSNKCLQFCSEGE